ncbi:MAG: thioredoxin family protein [Methanobacteriaceae archaeon]|nr:thioredoxin family protein [Methanobacteriaceae archaeon]
MNLFSKKEGCCCNNILNEQIKKMEKYEDSNLIILGNDYNKCKKLEENTKEALIELNLTKDIKIDSINDPSLIAMYEIINTPGLVIQSKVVSTGTILDKDKIIKLIEKYYKK